MRLPAEAQAPLPALWKKLSSSDQRSPYFGGLVSGDQVGRVGVRILGEGLVSSSGGRPGALVAPKRVIVRVGGYSMEWGLPRDGLEGVTGGTARRFWGGGGGGSEDCQVLLPPPLWFCAPSPGRHPVGTAW